MRAFDLAYRDILQIASGQSGRGLATQKVQTSAGQSRALPGVERVQTASALTIPDAVASVGWSFPLPWSHYVRLLSVRNPEARSFYETEALRGGWTIRQLDRQIGSQFYERTALSRNKVAMLRRGEARKPEDAVTPEEEVKDPYALEGLPNKVLAAEYRTALPNERLLAEEIGRTRKQLEARRKPRPPTRR
jgi:hypothetical protein